MFFHRSTLGPVDLAFTDRYGGVSGVPYDELNLALDSADEAENLARNHALVLADFGQGDQLVDLVQVHGSVVSVVEQSPSGRVEADGVVTARNGLTLMVRAADCVPVLFADETVGVIGAAHCGRLGLVAGIVPATVQRMRDLGAVSITAWVGPHICGACYEVPAAMQTEVGASAPEAVAITSWGTPSLDLGAGVRAQLDAARVTVIEVTACTRESSDLYSYRRDGVAAGRQAGLIRLRG